MSNALRFSLASVTYYWRRSLLLVVCIALAIYVPLTPLWLIQRAEHALENRAQSTPLILATKGSQTDLTLSALSPFFLASSCDLFEYSLCKATKSFFSIKDLTLEIYS